MAESFQEYQTRLLSYVRGRNARRILHATPGGLEKRLSGLSRRKLFKSPAEGKWSIAQILAHLAEVEMLWGYRIRTILERDGAEIVGIDQDAWATNSRYDRMDPRRSLQTFRAIRRANLDLIGALSPRSLARRGVHSQFGTMTISSIIPLLAGHDLNHSRQIDAILFTGRRLRAPGP